MARTVIATDGRTWTVRRQWLPWRIRFGRPWKPPSDSWSALDILDIGDVVPIIGWIFALLFLALLVFLFLPIAVFLLELVLFLGLAVLAGVVRLIFRRPWVVVAETEGPAAERKQWRVVGWRASGRAIDEVAEGLKLGHRAVHPRDAEPGAA